ncbi:MAG: response regulator [Desulfosarcinaceae bacterium]|nr:response regulator [Desulfosarcinaceae bacterium]
MEYNLLIVDDISENIQVLGHALAKEHYSVSFATDGHQALDMIAESAFDLILLDIMMPVMDGYEVCRRLKAMPAKSEIPVIFLTARTESVDIVKGFEVGAVDYVTKPFNAHELLARVRTHLELTRARKMIDRRNRQLARQNTELETINTELKRALERIKTLEGILPICSYCNKIRDEAGNWKQLESYISSHSEAEFSHGICPACIQRHHPDLAID